MFNIYKILFLALKKVWMFRVAPPQILTAKESPRKISYSFSQRGDFPPPLNAICKTLCVVWPYCVWFRVFFNCYLAAPWPTLSYYWGESLTQLMLTTAFLHFRSERHREPHNEVGSLSPSKYLVGFEPGTFRFFLQCLNPLDNSLHIMGLAFPNCPNAQIPVKEV